jgi:hypothetical protein
MTGVKSCAQFHPFNVDNHHLAEYLVDLGEGFL